MVDKTTHTEHPQIRSCHSGSLSMAKYFGFKSNDCFLSQLAIAIATMSSQSKKSEALHHSYSSESIFLLQDCPKMPLASSREAARKRAEASAANRKKAKRMSLPSTIKSATHVDEEKVRRRQSLSRQHPSNSLQSKENNGPGPTPYYQVRLDGVSSSLVSSLDALIHSDFC